jgi:hypothetical protein
VQVVSGSIGWWGGADLRFGTWAVLVLIDPIVARIMPLSARPPTAPG